MKPRRKIIYTIVLLIGLLLLLESNLKRCSRQQQSSPIVKPMYTPSVKDLMRGHCPDARDNASAIADRIRGERRAAREDCRRWESARGTASSPDTRNPNRLSDDTGKQEQLSEKQVFDLLDELSREPRINIDIINPRYSLLAKRLAASAIRDGIAPFETALGQEVHPSEVVMILGSIIPNSQVPIATRNRIITLLFERVLRSDKMQIPAFWALRGAGRSLEMQRVNPCETVDEGQRATAEATKKWIVPLAQRALEGRLPFTTKRHIADLLHQFDKTNTAPVAVFQRDLRTTKDRNLKFTVAEYLLEIDSKRYAQEVSEAMLPYVGTGLSNQIPMSIVGKVGKLVPSLAAALRKCLLSSPAANQETCLTTVESLGALAAPLADAVASVLQARLKSPPQQYERRKNVLGPWSILGRLKPGGAIPFTEAVLTRLQKMGDDDLFSIPAEHMARDNNRTLNQFLAMLAPTHPLQDAAIRVLSNSPKPSSLVFERAMSMLEEFMKSDLGAEEWRSSNPAGIEKQGDEMQAVYQRLSKLRNIVFLAERNIGSPDEARRAHLLARRALAFNNPALMKITTGGDFNALLCIDDQKLTELLKRPDQWTTP